MPFWGFFVQKKCKKSNFWPLKLPPFPEVKVVWCQIPRQGAPYHSDVPTKFCWNNQFRLGENAKTAILRNLEQLGPNFVLHSGTGLVKILNFFHLIQIHWIFLILLNFLNLNILKYLTCREVQFGDAIHGKILTI